MPGNNPAAAFRDFIEPIRRTVACITDDVVIVSPGGRRIPEQTNALTLASGEPIMLSDQGAGVTLSVGMLYQIMRNPNPGRTYKVSTKGYEYAFRTFGGQPIIEYHWHPLSDEGYKDPHIHVSGTKPHYPSARTSLESCVKAAIAEFGAEPYREDWESVLAMNDARFSLYCTWHDAAQLRDTQPELFTEGKQPG